MRRSAESLGYVCLVCVCPPLPTSCIDRSHLTPPTPAIRILGSLLISNCHIFDSLSSGVRCAQKMAWAAKRKRVVLTIQQKLDIVPNFERGSTVKQMCNQYNVGDSTVRDIVKNKDKLVLFRY